MEPHVVGSADKEYLGDEGKFVNDLQVVSGPQTFESNALRSVVNSPVDAASYGDSA